jgi:hypothetical protein
MKKAAIWLMENVFRKLKSFVIAGLIHQRVKKNKTLQQYQYC